MIPSFPQGPLDQQKILKGQHEYKDGQYQPVAAEPSEFPKWKYRGTESQLVKSAEEEQQLGAEWGDKRPAAATPVAADSENIRQENEDLKDEIGALQRQLRSISLAKDNLLEENQELSGEIGTLRAEIEKLKVQPPAKAEGAPEAKKK